LESSLQLWGGVECTVNRVHDRYFEQLKRTGHIARLSDFDRFAELGIKALRIPILWECTPSHDCQNARWRWADASLKKLESLGIRPIVGLVHHGSGPKDTSLIDPRFGEKLATYAEEVARRYPQVSDYTPVNEPLTTARFSALYGHWYPHRSDDHSFASALLNQCRAVILAMRAIRRINPFARLVQTEDLGKVYSTPAMSYQAEFENERRWASFDLLCGRVDQSHPMWGYFLYAGIQESELAWFLEHALPPDVVGVNHYLSGERYLDEHLDRYPDYTHGGNGRDRYADVLAFRVLKDGVEGISGLLQEAWQRYRRPIAITECHNGCTREEQLRWFSEVWQQAVHARRQGMNVIAVTAWSLLGAFDWNHLVTQDNGHYEPGVYDVRFSPPRPTALVELIRTVTAGDRYSDPVLTIPGWWRRNRRLVYGFSLDEHGDARPSEQEDINRLYPDARPVLITGGSGSLTKAFVRLCELRGLPYRVFSRDSFQTTDVDPLRLALWQWQPWAIVNAAAFNSAGSPHSSRSDCVRQDLEDACFLARECERHSLRFLNFSSDSVYDGSKGIPYVESDSVSPLTERGWQNVQLEKCVSDALPSALIVRSGPFFSPWDDSNFLVQALRRVAYGEQVPLTDNIVNSPTYLPDFVDACLDLLIDGERGIWHIANEGRISPAAFVEKVAEIGNLWPEDRPRRTQRDETRPTLCNALSSERAMLLPALDNAIVRFVQDGQLPLRLENGSQPAAA
jgi:dTDP-4-dehydrorhamnose reductase